jgi:hypothetical protein
MSFWLWRQGEDGKGWWTTVGIAWQVLTMILVPIAISMVSIASFETSVTFFLTPLGLGFLLFLIARLSVAGKRGLLAFGPSGMSGAMKACYWIGYALMSMAALLIIARWLNKGIPPYLLR